VCCQQSPTCWNYQCYCLVCWIPLFKTFACYFVIVSLKAFRAESDLKLEPLCQDRSARTLAPELLLISCQKYSFGTCSARPISIIFVSRCPACNCWPPPPHVTSDRCNSLPPLRLLQNASTSVKSEEEVRLS